LRVLLDTNVIISAVLFGGVPRDLIEGALRGDLELVTSPGLLTELQEVLTRKFAFAETIAASVRSELENLCTVIEPAEIAPVLPDPADNVVLATAAAGDLDAIVTGDRMFLGLQHYGKTPIIGPRELVERLQRREEDR
jgi:putative PIN family toxin of toxin-antitoxin system